MSTSRLFIRKLKVKRRVRMQRGTGPDWETGFFLLIVYFPCCSKPEVEGGFNELKKKEEKVKRIPPTSSQKPHVENWFA